MVNTGSGPNAMLWFPFQPTDHTEWKMEAKQQWVTPEFEPITGTGSRADGADIPVRNGVVSGFPD